MRRTVALLAVLMLTLGVPPGPSGAAPGRIDERPSRHERQEQARAEAAAKKDKGDPAGDQAPGTGAAATSDDPAGGDDAPPAGASSSTDSGQGAKFEPPAPGADRVPDSWIVALQPSADSDEAPELARASGGGAGQRFERVFEGFVFEGPQPAAERLARHPRVRKVSPNLVVEADAQTEPTGVRRIQADAARASATGAGVTVAVLDTGIDLDHPDLRENISGLGKNCVGGGSPDDDHGHGTHVAGTVAAADNGSQVVGVAPGAKLVPVKVLGRSGSGSYASIICGIDYVTANAGSIDVVNMSLSAEDDAGGCTDGSLRQAICRSTDAGVVYVAAAGNDDTAITNRAPANYPEVLTVSALDDRDGAPGGDRFASFSNFGSGVDLIAPGVNIVSTKRGGKTTVLSGTSMAAPHVAGVVALALSERAFSPGSMLNRLRETGECPNGSVAGGDRSCSGQGSWGGDGDSTAEPLVNALRASGSEGGSIPNGVPSVDISEPAGGASVTGIVQVVATATDPEGGSLDVEYQVNGDSPVSMELSSGQFRAPLDTAQLGPGSHMITVRATDPMGGEGSDSVTVTVNGDGGGGGGGDVPTVSITAPGPGTVGGRVTITAKADDAQDQTSALRVEYQIDDGSWVTMSYRSKKDDFKARWDSEKVGDGQHTITVRVTDAAGNPASASVTITVAN